MRRGRTRRGGNTKKTPVMLIVIAIFVIIFAIGILILKNENRKKQELISEQERQEYLSKIFEESEKELEKISNDDEKKVKPSKAKIKIVGNILLEKGVTNAAYNEQTKEYNFTPMFDDVKNIITDADLVIGNLETNFYGENYTDHNGPTNIIDTLKELRISAVNIANNQNLSNGVEGLISTKKELLDNGLKPYGTSFGDDDSKIVFQEVNGIKIAFLSYITKIDNRIELTEENEKYINIYSEETVDKDFEYVKNEGAEYIIVNIHTGSNAYRLSKEEHDNINNKLISSGADVVIGTHQYDIGTLEIKEKADGKKAFVANSMGNIIAEGSNLGMILEIQITKDENGITLSKVVYTPTYTLKNNNEYKILDIRETIKHYENKDNTIVTKDVYNTLKTQLDKLEKQIRE